MLPALMIKWTKPAEEQIQTMPEQARFQGDAKQWHEAKVREYAENNIPEATTARIR